LKKRRHELFSPPPPPWANLSPSSFGRPYTSA
jgi:hypothetical protein